MIKWSTFLSDMPLHSRNQFFEQKGIKAPTAYKTGTTIVGLVYKVRNILVLECDIHYNSVNILLTVEVVGNKLMLL